MKADMTSVCANIEQLGEPKAAVKYTNHNSMAWDHGLRCISACLSARDQLGSLLK